MTEKDLIKKLNSLKQVSPDGSWKSSHREILLSQISNTSLEVKENSWSMFFEKTKNLLAVVSQPALVGVSMVVLLLVGALYSHKMFNNVKPNDSLYIAKILSERVKLETVLDQNEKEKMATRFANNHAKDIASTLSNPEFNREENQTVIEKLNNDFKAEIAKVKESIARQEVEKNNVLQREEDGLVYSADSGKEENGLSTTGLNQDAKVIASSAPEVIVGKVSPKSIIEEAEKLFNEARYEEALSKLEEVSGLIQ